MTALLAARRCLYHSRMHRKLPHWGNPTEQEIMDSQMLSFSYARAGVAILANAETREAHDERHTLADESL